jgi:hypothetical protein
MPAKVNPPQPPPNIRAKLSPEVADGIYANVANIIFSPVEFIIDFGRIVPGKPEFNILSRIITNPMHAKQLALALKENVERYEAKYGEIKLRLKEDDAARIGF